MRPSFTVQGLRAKLFQLGPHQSESKLRGLVFNLGFKCHLAEGSRLEMA